MLRALMTLALGAALTAAVATTARRMADPRPLFVEAASPPSTAVAMTIL